MSSDLITVVGESPGVHRVWAWQNVVVVSWLGRPSAEAAAMLGPLSELVLSRVNATKLSYVHLVPDRLELPDAPTRSAFLELTRVYGSRTACIAIVLHGAGFWASAIRGFVTGISVIAPRSIDFRLHADPNELLDWFPQEHARKTGVQVSGAALLRQLESVRSDSAG